MDKWKNKDKAVTIGADSLLPPTRRIANVNPPPPLLDKRRSRKWSIDGFFKKVSSILDAQSSSSSLEDSSERQRRKIKDKAKGMTKPTGYAYKNPEGLEYSPPGIYRTSNNNEDYYDASRDDLVNANMNESLDLLDARLAGNNSHSRSSDGSLDGPSRRIRKDKVKARVEAKRDQLCVGDSSMDESSNEDTCRNGHKESSKRRSRASRTERYLKRICNEGSNANRTNGEKLINVADSRNLEGRGIKLEEFRPIDRLAHNDYTRESTGNGICNGNVYPATGYCNNDIPKENPYKCQNDIGVNPLVQQTLQYFSEFDRNMAASQHKARKTYPGHGNQHHRRIYHKSNPCDYTARNDIQPAQSLSSVTPPKPPSRDHRSLEKYHQMLRYVQRSPDSSLQSNQLNKENELYENPCLSRLHSPNTELRNINEGRHSVSPSSTMHKYRLPLNPSTSPLRDFRNSTAHYRSGNNIVERHQSPLSNVEKSKSVDETSTRFSPNLQINDYTNSNYVPYKKLETDKTNERRSSKNLEEALCELEAIYNSLQLGDEELLDRAEKRTMEEFLYKGFTASPEVFDNEDSSSRRKTWGDDILGKYKEQPEIADRLKDDMAYRRMHPKERPSSVDGPSSLSSISYLMTSPIPSRRGTGYIDPKRKLRRKEPDVTLDDVVFRSMQYANNTLKVVQPQPPFGIPLGPITTATESDYLHANPGNSERSRSPYIPSQEPDLVTDDLAFRNLRKDAHSSCSSRQASPCLIKSPSPLSFGVKKKRAVRSLSANLYGLINKPTSPRDLDSDQCSVNTNSTFDDFLDEVPIKCITRRTSDPEVMSSTWQNNTWKRSDANRNRINEQLQRQHLQQIQRDHLSPDAELNNKSSEESSDEKVQLQDRFTLQNRDEEQKTGSEKSSSQLSSSCSTPPPLPPRTQIKPFTEQEISVYKQLCQDLENLVELTKGIDTIPIRREPPSPLPPSAKKAIAIIEEIATPKSVRIAASNSSTQVKSDQSRTAEVIDNNNCEEESNKDVSIEISPIKREISNILDSLKNLGEDSKCSNISYASITEDLTEEEIDAHNASFEKLTKEICDLTAKDKEEDKEAEKVKSTIKNEKEELKAEEEESKDKVDDNVFSRNINLNKQKEKDKSKDEEEERTDRLDENVFFRNVQLAKLSGDWKESTPNGATASMNRRTSLVAGVADNVQWEGEISSCEQCVSMVCNASNDMSRLTAKYICYITNHITAQFCLLLVFFLVLLLAIVTVP